MIVVMGASGPTGEALVHRLLEKGQAVRAVTRDPGRLRARLDPVGVDVRYADAADEDSLVDSFAGANQIFLAMANSPAQVDLETRVVATAAKCSIEHIVKLSAPYVAPDSPVAISRWHHAIECALADSGIPNTLLRPYAFMQKTLNLVPDIASAGAIYGSMGATACNFIDCRDIADVAAEVLTRPELAGASYELTADRTYSYPQIAAMLGALLGLRIDYVDLPADAMRRRLRERAHMPDWLAAHVVEIQQIALARNEIPTSTVTDLLGRSPRTLEAFLAENLDSFRPTVSH
ncbi:uncharacterized protein YbjT (DUF2867 family) [Prescottella agglutinans]|uniref:Uncharacterized protein YbjT (DUF2867 family) n=2 Tax=Prescottella agglutinans TaxID=1644129 RepID=A0ABT6MHI1_9NOCA|nr:uncharacterized protein YbjT (DUF2867 family) [Prescottella agglutinans]